jgi:hypothetical protein
MAGAGRRARAQRDIYEAVLQRTEACGRLAGDCFYGWRKRLRDRQQPMRCALVQTGGVRPEPAKGASLELVLASGERLRIGAGVDTTTLRAVLEVLRA